MVPDLHVQYGRVSIVHTQTKPFLPLRVEGLGPGLSVGVHVCVCVCVCVSVSGWVWTISQQVSGQFVRHSLYLRERSHTITYLALVLL